MPLQLLLWIVATVLFGVATFLTPARYNLVAAGLAFLAAGFVAGGID
jgi:hypothetical protein